MDYVVVLGIGGLALAMGNYAFVCRRSIGDQVGGLMIGAIGVFILVGTIAPLVRLRRWIDGRFYHDWRWASRAAVPKKFFDIGAAWIRHDSGLALPVLASSVTRAMVLGLAE